MGPKMLNKTSLPSKGAKLLRYSKLDMKTNLATYDSYHASVNRRGKGKKNKNILRVDLFNVKLVN